MTNIWEQTHLHIVVYEWVWAQISAMCSSRGHKFANASIYLIYRWKYGGRDFNGSVISGAVGEFPGIFSQRSRQSNRWKARHWCENRVNFQEAHSSRALAVHSGSCHARLVAMYNVNLQSKLYQSVGVAYIRGKNQFQCYSGRILTTKGNRCKTYKIFVERRCYSIDFEWRCPHWPSMRWRRLLVSV